MPKQIRTKLLIPKLHGNTKSATAMALASFLNDYLPQVQELPAEDRPLITIAFRYDEDFSQDEVVITSFVQDDPARPW